jgi:polyisoprenoid-binding protein YceI
MKKKSLYILGGMVVLAVVLFMMFGFTAPDENLTRAGITGNVIAGEREAMFDVNELGIDSSNSKIEFEGYGPGKSHVGVFDEWEGFFYVKDREIVGFKGVIQVASANTGIDGLDSHLMKDDFFNEPLYPEISFDGMIADGMAVGDLSLHGVTNEVSFPVEVMENGIKADFVLDMTPFGMEHAAVNQEVRIAFDFAK